MLTNVIVVRTILCYSLKIAWFDIFFLKVFSKASPVVFSSNSLKVSVYICYKFWKIICWKRHSLKVSILFGMNSEDNNYYCLVVSPENILVLVSVYRSHIKWLVPSIKDSLTSLLPLVIIFDFKRFRSSNKLRIQYQLTINL